METKWKNNIHNSNYKEKKSKRDDDEAEDSGGDAFWQDAVFCLMSTSSSKLLCMF